MTERFAPSRELYRVLDRVLATGVLVEIESHGRRLRIAPVEGGGRLANMRPHPDYLLVDPDVLVGSPLVNTNAIIHENYPRAVW